MGAFETIRPVPAVSSRRCSDIGHWLLYETILDISTELRDRFGRKVAKPPCWETNQRGYVADQWQDL